MIGSKCNLDWAIVLIDTKFIGDRPTGYIDLAKEGRSAGIDEKTNTLVKKAFISLDFRTFAHVSSTRFKPAVAAEGCSISVSSHN